MSDPINRAKDEFHLTRARALNAYAGLEQSLAILFSTLNSKEIRESYAEFGKLFVTRSRIQRLSDLMRIEFENQHDLFFRSLLQHLSDLTKTRNRIVHWIVMVSTTGGKEFDPDRDVKLYEHPNIFGTSELSKSDLLEFENKAEFFRLLVFYFDFYLRNGDRIAPGGAMNWSQVFQRPAEYPPPGGHPLNRNNATS